jgi:hypothetical protein
MYEKLELAIDRIEESIRQQEPMIGRIFIEADLLKLVARSPVLSAQG